VGKFEFYISNVVSGIGGINISFGSMFQAKCKCLLFPSNISHPLNKF
jgi:hypothetical protein